jgi:long-chain fatty acid transport protein
MGMTVHRAPRLALLLAAFAAPISAGALHAQAFGLNEIGSCAIARGYATTASPCHDASTIYWNSAAATSLTGWSVLAGVAAIKIDGSFTQDTTRRRWDATVPTQWVPHAFVNYHDSSSSVAYGVGFYVPYGLTSEWPGDFPGRFSAQKATLKTFYIQPNFAWRFNDKWSVGGGPIFGHSSVELDQALDLSLQVAPAPGNPTFGQLGIATGTEFALAKLKGSASAWGAQIAIAGHPYQGWSVGARFLTPLEFKYDNADASFSQVPTNLVVGGTLSPQVPVGTPIDAILAPQFQAGGALVSQTVSTKITHPAQIQAGVAYTGYKDWLFEADYAWVGWKRFDVLPVIFQGPAAAASRTLIENYNNSSAIRLGAEYTIPNQGWKLRGGFAGVASAAPPETVTPLLPEQDRNYWTLGAGYLINKYWGVDASYAHVSTPGARGRIIERTTTQNTNLTAAQLNTGVYNISANIFSISLKASY